MKNYWDETSLPTTQGMPLVRPPMAARAQPIVVQYRNVQLYRNGIIVPDLRGDDLNQHYGYLRFVTGDAPRSESQTIPIIIDGRLFEEGFDDDGNPYLKFLQGGCYRLDLGLAFTSYNNNDSRLQLFVTCNWRPWEPWQFKVFWRSFQSGESETLGGSVLMNIRTGDTLIVGVHVFRLSGTASWYVNFFNSYPDNLTQSIIIQRVST